MQINLEHLHYWMCAIRESKDPMRTMDAFWRGQMQSKEWLIKELTQVKGNVKSWPNVDIHGGWVGVLASMLFQSGMYIDHINSIDIDPEFIAVVDALAGREPAPDSRTLPQGIVHFERQQETDWDWIPYMRAVQAGSVVASYHAKYHCDDQTEFVLDVQTDKWRNKTVLIVPRMGMQQDQDRLYLDTGHWGPGENPVLLINPQNTLVVKHNIKTGIITYSIGT